MKAYLTGKIDVKLDSERKRKTWLERADPSEDRDSLTDTYKRRVCGVLVTCALYTHALFVIQTLKKTVGLCCLAEAWESPAVLCPD